MKRVVKGRSALGTFGDVAEGSHDMNRNAKAASFIRITLKLTRRLVIKSDRTEV